MDTDRIGQNIEDIYINKEDMYMYPGTCIHKYTCVYVTNMGGDRRRLDSDTTDVGLSGFPKEQQTHSGDGI